MMAVDKDEILVEKTNNYIAFIIKGEAELVGMDNRDSTDYDEYRPKNGKINTRRLFQKRLVAIIRAIIKILALKLLFQVKFFQMFL